MASYETTINFIDYIDAQIRDINVAVDKERERKAALASRVKVIEKNLSSLKQGISVLSNQDDISDRQDFTIQKLTSWLSEMRKVNISHKNCVSCSERIIFIHAQSISQKTSLTNEVAKSRLMLDGIKKHKDYNTWIKKADSLEYECIPDAMPENIYGYSPSAINAIISFSSAVIWSPYKRYMFWYLFIIYKRALKEVEYHIQLIDQYEAIIKESKELINKWLAQLNTHIVNLQKEQNALSYQLLSFDEDSADRLVCKLNTIKQDINQEFPDNDYNDTITQSEETTSDWRKIRSNDDILTSHRNRFMISHICGSCREIFSSNTYTNNLADYIVGNYKWIFKDGNILGFHLPLWIDIDTSRFSFNVNYDATDIDCREGIVGIAQNIVATLASNIPVGKARFVFSDPTNTGIFSTFRDLGKNVNDGSNICSYIVDASKIASTLHDLSSHIADTINNILKGPNTTLYQHNKERSFNSTPYYFLFLMNFPHNMLAQSLLDLKNIVDNGPKCGIFAFIFNAKGTSYDLLSPEEQHLVSDIVKSDYEYKDGRFYNPDGYYLEERAEINTNSFDIFVNYYNDAIKDSQTLSVVLDDLDKCTCEAGEFKIPIGKNLGGDTEYMSFIGSCQNYLMSGAPRIGKSNALHVIIINTLKCIPDAELYLVDFKQGVEFAAYARLNHPSLKAVAVESVPEFGYSVLKHIEEKIKIISELFRSKGVEDWKSYYKTTNGESSIPVSIIIIDEFQHLFETETGKECSRIIEHIAREGAAFNVHLVLATQSMNNIRGLTVDARDNIFGRMVFYHSETEYNAMLWGNKDLALTLRSDDKGQMVFATGDNSPQRKIQWASVDNINNIIDDINKIHTDVRYNTKLLLSSARDNPYSLFNVFIKFTKSSLSYEVKKKKLSSLSSVFNGDYDFAIGTDVNIDLDDIRKEITHRKKSSHSDVFVERSFLQIKEAENLLFVGNSHNLAESCFQHILYSLLVQLSMKKAIHSVILLAPEDNEKIKSIADAFPDIIDFYGQESDISQINVSAKKFFIVYGLHNFRSLSYQPDSHIHTLSEAEHHTGIPISLMQSRTPASYKRPESLIFKEAISSHDIKVICWHNNLQGLTSMFGGETWMQDFLDKFKHKIVFKLLDRNDSVVFTGSDMCTNLSDNAAVYIKMNRERIIRPYRSMDDKYCESLIDSIKSFNNTNHKEG